MKILLAKPYQSAKSLNIAKEVIKLGEISGTYGKYISKFEKVFAKKHNLKFGISCTNGTSSLHLATKSLNIERGDEVLCSTTTNMASFFSILYNGAKPIPVDIEGNSFSIDTNDLEKKITKKTKAIMAVHLFGYPCNMIKISEIAKNYKLKLIEDCSEAHGSQVNNKLVGTFGDIGCFSFFSNKNLNCGEGGISITNKKYLYQRMKNLRNLSFGIKKKFYHTEIGYNYRMSNIQASLAYQQTIEFEEIINKRIKICKYYDYLFQEFGLHEIIPPKPEYGVSTYWMYHLLFKNLKNETVEKLRQYLKSVGIETREGFVPFNLQKNLNIQKKIYSSCPVASKLNGKSFYIPTFIGIKKIEQEYIVEKISKKLKLI